jgi:hypothetical protein
MSAAHLVKPKPPIDGPRACRRCGCCDFRVVTTWRLRDGTIRRQRVCRHCGQDSYTSEERPSAT